MMDDRGALPTLALSGSNPTGQTPFSAALRTAGAIASLQSPAGQRGDLAVLAQQLCQQHGLGPAELAELRIDLGPGSYTGLRVAVTLTRFVQHFAGIPVLAIDTLSLLARCSVAPGCGQRLRPVLDARMGRYHTGTLHYHHEQLVAAAPPVALRPAVWLDSLAAGDLVIAPAALGEALASELQARSVAVCTAQPVTAAALFLPGLSLQACSSATLQPHYLIGSYAEEPA
jgi:tRNA threonylcarbamoyl adenosine modification protein YeaZ